MKILAMSKVVFDNLLFEKGITFSNVEQQDKLLFISINNNGGIVTEGDIPFFPKDKKNVKVMYFSDVEKHQIMPLIGVKGEFLALAMTKEQAADLYAFIKDNIKGKEAVLIHCTAGVSRSGAVASFIFDYLSTVKWDNFKKDNPQIQPNAHVYRLLHDEWYKDLEFPEFLKGWNGEVMDEDTFKLEVMNPVPVEQQIAIYNHEHPDQHTTLEYLTREEIKEKYGNEIAVDFCNTINNTQGLLPDQKAYPRHAQEMVASEKEIKERDSTSFVDKVRPFSNHMNSKIVKVKDKFTIKDRGEVWVMDAEINELPGTIGGQRLLLGHLIRELGTFEVYEIIGVELPAIADDDFKLSFVGALVKFKSTVKE